LRQAFAGKELMKKISSLGSPTPNGHLHSRSPFLHPGFFQKQGISVSFAFALLCLVLSVSSASAQTRPKRTGVKPEERLRRVDDQEQVDVKESGKADNVKLVPQPPSQPYVRKTAMTYSPRTGNQNVEGPALTNDIVIISRAEDTAPARRMNSLKIGAKPSNVPSIWPVTGTLRSGVGMRNNPFGGSSVEYHKGQDIAAPTGTPVNVTADGVVVIAGWVRGYGNGIYVDHGNGITTRYGHLSRIDVVVGQTVKRGEHLGLVGSTGRSTGPHLHYEVRIDGQPTSPLQYLPPVAPAPSGQ
jgi:murein DD-endopeptidase MepM/ murein hydrolase activator NlpD